MHKRVLTQARRPRADPLRARTRSPTASTAPSPAAGAARAERAPALASAARRVGRLREPPAGPHVPAAARVQPAGADHRPRASDRGAGRRLRRRGVREPVPDAYAHGAHDPPPPSIVPTAPGATAPARWSCSRRTRRRRWARCRSSHLELLLEVWADRYRELGARDRRRVRLPVREPRRRGRRDAAPSARADLRLSVRAADPGARARAAARASRGARPRPARAT